MTAAGRGDATPEDVFTGSPRGLALCRAVEAMLAVPAPPEIRVTRSQVAFREARGFAYVWWPGRYVRSDVPAVLSIALRSRIVSARFKSVVNPSPGVWMHHLELRSEADLDAEVAGWLRRARDEAR
ncbi:DUF5655 domain-containing protein [Arthrobacter sp. NicSoilB8]|uniref:DUF5655 domain-containing protein n=1 Tax=Arthrobacter sp. NicSoilB8 TaxID=2830998 RepID=UPI001CC35BB5|nr:DUF5655 domain-containing protein [Arthrobacter sp. NicSoilB8]BCW71219.1 hypothetical protein NicSoilB8_22630 [Arthrobacter sp. NicSoilB8]